MNNNLTLKNDENQPINSDEILQATSLLYFKDALKNEQYEACPELIQTARTFGAQQEDISAVIAEFLSGVKASQADGANNRIGGRLGFKEGA